MKIKRITIILVLVFLIAVFIIIKGYISSSIEGIELMENSEFDESSDLQNNKNSNIKGERSSYFF